jgi:hypothetical protein
MDSHVLTFILTDCVPATETVFTYKYGVGVALSLLLLLRCAISTYARHIHKEAMCCPFSAARNTSCYLRMVLEHPKAALNYFMTLEQFSYSSLDAVEMAFED